MKKSRYGMAAIKSLQNGKGKSIISFMSSSSVLSSQTGHKFMLRCGEKHKRKKEERIR
jgi:hypothetical protein